MGKVAVPDVGEVLVDLGFYETIESARNDHLGEAMGSEDVAARNAMVKHLCEVLPEGCDVLDIFSGDGVVPLALLYLQKNYPGGFHRIASMHCIDDNFRHGFDVLRKSAERLGIDPPELVTADVNGNGWEDCFKGGPYVATVVDAMYAECMPAPALVFPKLAGVAGTVEAVQAKPIHGSYIEELREAGYQIEIGQNGFHYVRARLPAEHDG